MIKHNLNTTIENGSKNNTQPERKDVNIEVSVKQVYENGNIDFLLKSNELSSATVLKTSGLNNAATDIANMLSRLLNTEFTPDLVYDDIVSLYHGYMRNILNKIIRREIAFTGGTLYDYQ